MRRIVPWILLLSLLPLAFLAGRRAGTRPAAEGGRRVLYYEDPMNPAFRSPEPGVGPCGMALEPVYADGAEAGVGPPRPGAISVRPERQQLIGVTVAPVQREAVRHTLRLLGRVAPAETGLYQVSALTRGWIRELGSATTGSLVAKGQVLGAYYAPEALAPQQTFLYTVEAYENLKKTGSNPYDNMQGGGQLGAYENNLRVGRQTLLNYGMPPEQIDEIIATRKPATLVQIRSPAAGFVVSRDVVAGQSFSQGDVLFRIADLRQVWVLTDAFEGDERFLRPGTRATAVLAGEGRSFSARVSRVPPTFDDSTRTLKVRLEVDNPAFTLRPGMFVDVEVPVETGASLAVPKDAVLDSGTRRVVFVEKEPGIFEARPVETGWRYADRVQIVSGLMEGERVVSSGNFLLDSESRMRTASARLVGPTARDPVCGMEVEQARSKANGLTRTYDGVTYTFCTPKCLTEFDQDPSAHVPERPNQRPAGAMAQARAGRKERRTSPPMPAAPLGQRMGSMPDMPAHAAAPGHGGSGR